MAILPYMNQLPQDFYSDKYFATYAPEQRAPGPIIPTPLPPDTEGPTEPIEPLEPPPDIPPPIVDAAGILVGNEGGAWFGQLPPINPGAAWMWFNSDDSIMYVHTGSETWVSVRDGTEWVSPFKYKKKSNGIGKRRSKR